MTRAQLTHSHVTAPTQFVEANGIRFAYRRFGNETRVPLLFMQHFRDGMDHWDPAVTDGLSEDRPVILFDNAGVSSGAINARTMLARTSRRVKIYRGVIRLTEFIVLRVLWCDP
jgi:hypothetical protein